MANLNEFNSSLETTRRWIDELMITVGADEPRACQILRATLHELRDHLTVEEVADLAAQLPMLLRGVFYEGWKPHGKPVKERSKEQFLGNIANSLSKYYDAATVEGVVRDVFRFLDRRVSPGEIRDMVHTLPKDLQSLWP